MLLTTLSQKFLKKFFSHYHKDRKFGNLAIRRKISHNFFLCDYSKSCKYDTSCRIQKYFSLHYKGVGDILLTALLQNFYKKFSSLSQAHLLQKNT